MSDGECGAAPAAQRVVGVIEGGGGGAPSPRPTSRAPSADITSRPVDSLPL